MLVGKFAQRPRAQLYVLATVIRQGPGKGAHPQRPPAPAKVHCWNWQSHSHVLRNNGPGPQLQVLDTPCPGPPILATSSPRSRPAGHGPRLPVGSVA